MIDKLPRIYSGVFKNKMNKKNINDLHSGDRFLYRNEIYTYQDKLSAYNETMHLGNYIKAKKDNNNIEYAIPLNIYVEKINDK